MKLHLSNNNKMGTPFLQELKTQASFFFKEKIKTARLALTDVTPAQLLTEEATNGDPWAPDTRTMRLISQAAFEVDDYWRIVDILHTRLERFDKKKWRGCYKAIVILEHLLTHGPERVGEEFQSDKDVFRQLGSFQYVDEKGFNWGLSMRKKCEWVLKLLEDRKLLKEERARARRVTSGIKGFGSFNFHDQHSSLSDECFEGSKQSYLRSNSQFIDQNQVHHVVLDSNLKLKAQETDYEELKLVSEKPARNSNSWEMNHPFCDSEHQSGASLLSSRS